MVTAKTTNIQSSLISVTSISRKVDLESNAKVNFSLDRLHSLSDRTVKIVFAVIYILLYCRYEACNVSKCFYFRHTKTAGIANVIMYLSPVYHGHPFHYWRWRQLMSRYWPGLPGTGSWPAAGRAPNPVRCRKAARWSRGCVAEFLCSGAPWQCVTPRCGRKSTGRRPVRSTTPVHPAGWRSKRRTRRPPIRCRGGNDPRNPVPRQRRNRYQRHLKNGNRNLAKNQKENFSSLF